MVCVATEVRVECVVQDGTNKTESNSFTVPASTTLDDLYKQISKIHKCDPNSFELAYKALENTVMIGVTKRDMTLMELAPNCLHETTTFVMTVIDQPRKTILEPPGKTVSRKTRFERNPNDFIKSGDKISQASAFETRRVVIGDFRFDQLLSDVTIIDVSDDFLPRLSKKNYVGLVNQAMTCYLNSLLQALYMTPEFRNALYNWEYVEDSEKDESRSIPYQLQKLFLNLQTSTKPAVETTSLTKSFGWDSTEAWQQHDIQELCRVMFDALETKFKDTEQADFINRLYEGKMIDYVKCLECKTEKSREDTFLDIPLPVRPFESTVAYGSVEEALRAFVKYETLDGNNQYHCEKCNKKCDAHKGLKFTKFPYLLTLHLKRFDFDYNTFYRIKLNDKVTFPHTLDLNSFIETTHNQDSPSGEEDVGMSVKCDDSSTTDSGTLEDECPSCDAAMSSSHSNNHDQDDDEGIDMSNGISATNGIAHNHENAKHRGKCLIDRGPYVYELFSIMIHSGSASGGHYYAYIKDFKTNQWLCFNDTTVNPITESDIQRVYGGGPTRAYSSSTNAYMLMYRQIDPNKNALPMQEENFPQHIKMLLQKMKETEDDDRRYHGRQTLSYKIEVFCRHPKTKMLMMNKLHMIGDSTWAEQTEKAYEKFGLHGIVSLKQCRLVFYNSMKDLITHCYDGSDEDLIYDVFKGDKNTDLLLEIREKDQQFESYKPDGIATRVYVVDLSKTDIIDGPINVRGYLSQTVREFKQQLRKIVNIDPSKMKIVSVIVSQYQLLQDDKTLDEEGLEDSNLYKLYVCETFEAGTTISSKPTTNESSNLDIFSIIEELDKVIWLHIQLPTVSKEIMEELVIPSLENENKEESIKSPSNSPMETSTDEAPEENSDEINEKVQTNDDLLKKCLQDLGLESASEDSSLSDSEKTLVYDKTESQDTYKRLKEIYGGNFPTNYDSDEESNYYFKDTSSPSEKNEKLLRVLVDYRMRLRIFKKKLEPFVGVPVDYFNIYSQHADSPDTECTNLKLNLEAYHNGDRFCIKLGRALRKGELKVKLYQLHLDCPDEPFKFLFDWIISKDMTVAQAKEEIIGELKKKYDLKIPFERLRLRKRTFYPARVLLNNDKFKDILPFFISSRVEIVIQELQEDETVVDSNQMVFFVRRWSRSSLQLGPFQEVVIDERSVFELKRKIELLSKIPEEFIEIAKCKGPFPCENISLLNVETDLDWNVKMKSLNLENGCVVLYRDSSEAVKQLSSEEKREFTNKENSRLLCLGTTPSYNSPRREKALKIYLDSK